MSQTELETSMLQTFTPEFARKITVALGLTVKDDIMHVTDSQIDSLDLMDGQKDAFKRMRDRLIGDHQLAEKLAILKKHGV